VAIKLFCKTLLALMCQPFSILRMTWLWLDNKIKTINNTQEKRINLGFNKEKLAIYDEEITLNFSLKDKKFTLAKLTLQACSDKVCLPPQQIKISINP
jgi:hypothetical protein